MSKPKWTPGPWEVCRDSGLNIYIRQPEHAKNRTPGYYAEVRRFTSDAQQVEANARLIAAAPDLYEALDAIVSAQTMDDLCHCVDIGRAALAKARGK